MKKVYIMVFLFFFSFISIASVSALSVVVHIPEKYTNVNAGERLYFEIEIKYPENPSRKDLRLNYEILKDDKIIAQSKVLKAVETQASFMDFIIIPENSKTGLYIIKVKIADYKNLSEEVEASFYVNSKDSSQIKLYFFILLGVVILVGILVVISIILNRRR